MFILKWKSEQIPLSSEMRLNPLHLSCNVSDPFPTAYETFQSSLCVSWAHANNSLKPQAQPVYFSRVNFTCQQQLNAIFLVVCLFCCNGKIRKAPSFEGMSGAVSRNVTLPRVNSGLGLCAHLISL